MLQIEDFKRMHEPNKFSKLFDLVKYSPCINDLKIYVGFKP